MESQQLECMILVIVEMVKKREYICANCYLTLYRKHAQKLSAFYFISLSKPKREREKHMKNNGSNVATLIEKYVSIGLKWRQLQMVFNVFVVWQAYLELIFNCQYRDWQNWCFFFFFSFSFGWHLTLDILAKNSCEMRTAASNTPISNMLQCENIP